MNDAPLVSVVVPTHRRPEWLRRALRSVLAQTYPAIEVHVVENGGRAGAQAVVDELTRADRPIRYHYLEAGSVAAARNLGIRHARSEYCAFLDDDDEWLPDKLMLQMPALQAAGHLGWIACRVWRVFPSGEMELQVHSAYSGTPSLPALVTEGCFIWTPSCVIIRRGCFARVGMFDPRWRTGADYDLYLRLARHFPFAVLDDPLVRYYQHDQNMSGNTDRMMRGLMRILSTLKPAPERGLTAEMIRDGVALYSTSLYTNGIDARDQGRYDVAAAKFWAAVRHDPAIGLRIPWSRVNSPAYRAARPYVNLALCGAKAWLRPQRRPKGADADRLVS